MSSSPPAPPRAPLDRAIVLHEAGDLAQAAAIYQDLLREEPGHAEALHLLGVAHQQSGRDGLAVRLIRQAIAVHPSDARFYSHLAVSLRRLGRLAEAVHMLQRVLAFTPRFAPALNNLGNALQAQGRVAEAMGCFGTAAAHDPGFAAAHDNFIYSRLFLPETTPQAALADHRCWSQVHAAAIAAAAPRPPLRQTPPRRIGLVSADFRRHQVAYYVVRVVEALAAMGIAVTCYASQSQQMEDSTSARFRAVADWRAVAGLDDGALAELVRADGIDVLIDLSGHFAGHRLLTFARRPAPLQLTWAGYPGTTGMDVFDGIIGDPHEIPAGAEGDYSEPVLRMPGCWICYDPPADAPAVAAPPWARRGHVTLGSLNTPPKLGPAVAATWAEILAGRPSARLLLGYRGLDDGSTGERIAAMIRAHGIARERIELRGEADSHAAFLAYYHDIDLALDPFPFSGSVTTCEALWMGAPVLTWPGPTFAGRHSLSILANVGLDDLVAGDRADYVARALALAGDPARLAGLRAGLRARVAASPLVDGRRFAADLMDLIERAWRGREG